MNQNGWAVLAVFLDRAIVLQLNHPADDIAGLPETWLAVDQS